MRVSGETRVSWNSSSVSLLCRLSLGSSRAPPERLRDEPKERLRSRLILGWLGSGQRLSVFETFSRIFDVLTLEYRSAINNGFTGET